MRLLEAPKEMGVVHTIELKKGEALPNPASTKHLIYGPQKLEWYQHPAVTVDHRDAVGLAAPSRGRPNRPRLASPERRYSA